MRSVFPLIAVGLLIPTVLWWYSVGNPTDYLGDDVPVGQALYIFSKLAGLIAIFFLGLQLFLVLARTSKLNRYLKWSLLPHRTLGIVVMGLVLLHAALFVAAVSLRSGHLALGPLSVRLQQGFYDQMLSIGAIALYMMLVLFFVGFSVMKSGSATRLKILHRSLAFVAALFAIVHSYAIGSDTTSWPMLVFYTVLVVAILYAVVNRTLVRHKSGSLS